MSEARFHWPLDVGIPRISDNSLAAVYAEDLSRTPGPVGLTEAVALKRSLITRDRSFRGSWALPLAHHGIVILEVERNLQHLEFRLKQQEGSSNPLESRRFLIKMDRAVLQIEPDGCELDLELWRRVHIQPGRAPSAHPAPV